MTLITWTGGLKEISRRVMRLETSSVSANFMRQLAYVQFDFEECFGRTTAKTVSHYSVLPTYAPLVSYAGLGNVSLYYKPQSSEEYLISASASLFRTLMMSDFYLDGLLMKNSSGGLSAKLSLTKDKYLDIGEETIAPHKMIMPKLLQILSL